MLWRKKQPTKITVAVQPSVMNRLRISSKHFLHLLQGFWQVQRYQRYFACLSYTLAVILLDASITGR